MSNDQDSKNKAYALWLLSAHEADVHTAAGKSDKEISVSRSKFDLADYYSPNYSGLYEFTARTGVKKGEYEHEDSNYIRFNRQKLEELSGKTLDQVLDEVKKAEKIFARALLGKHKEKPHISSGGGSKYEISVALETIKNLDNKEETQGIKNFSEKKNIVKGEYSHNDGEPVNSTYGANYGSGGPKTYVRLDKGALEKLAEVTLEQALAAEKFAGKGKFSRKR